MTDVSLPTFQTPPQDYQQQYTVRFLQDIEDALRRLNNSIQATGGGGVADGNYGDIIVSGGGTVWGIALGAVQFNRIQDVAANSVLARAAATPGVVGEVAVGSSQLFGRGATGDLAPITLGTNLSMSGTTLNAAGSSGVPDGDKGDITVTGSGTVWTIDPAAVTYAKIQAVGANSVLTRASAASGDVGETALASSTLLGRGSTGNVAAITLGSGLSMAGTVLSAVVADGDRGDITVSGSGATWTIDPGVVSYAKIQNVSGNAVLARANAAAGSVGEVVIGGSQLFGRGATGDLTAITLGTNLSMSGTTLNAAAGSVPDGDKGDITVSGGGTVWSIDAGVVTNAKLAPMATARIKGRITAGSGDPEDLTAAQATSLLDVFTPTLKGLVPASGGGTTNFLRADGTFAAPVTALNINGLPQENQFQRLLDTLPFYDASAAANRKATLERIRGTHTVNVLDFYSGSGTYTAAFNAALATGKTVWVPDGTYLIDNQLSALLDGQYIIGESRQAIILMANTTSLPVIQAYNRTNVGVLDLTIDCGDLKYNPLGVNTAPINFFQCDQMHVERCRILRADRFGIAINACTRYVVRDNYARVAFTQGLTLIEILTNPGGGTPGTYPFVISGGGGAGMSATYTVGGGGTVTSVAITSSGRDYTSVPTVSAPNAGGATFRFKIGGIQVQAITISSFSGGSNYGIVTGNFMDRGNIYVWSDNVVVANNVTWGYCYGSGIFTQPASPGVASNIVVVGNIMALGGWDGSAYIGYDIDITPQLGFESNSYYTTIMGNVVHSCAGDGFSLIGKFQNLNGNVVINCGKAEVINATFPPFPTRLPSAAIRLRRADANQNSDFCLVTSNLLYSPAGDQSYGIEIEQQPGAGPWPADGVISNNHVVNFLTNDYVIGGSNYAVSIPQRRASLAVTPGSIANGSSQSFTITVPGARVGDAVNVGYSGALVNGFFLAGRVTAANTVVASIHNQSGGAATPGAGTLTAVVSPVSL